MEVRLSVSGKTTSGPRGPNFVQLKRLRGSAYPLGREHSQVAAMMTQPHKTFWRWAFFIGFACSPARAQQGVQFLPEIDTYLKLNSVLRMYVEAKSDRDGGDPLQAGIGPSIQLYLKPLVKLKEVTAFDLDEAKSRFFILEAGYRVLVSPDAPTENRMLTSATFNFPMKAGFHLSDRNRADLDWINGKFTWRYRNELTVERTVSVRAYHLIPYVAAEPYYVSQFNKWSTTALYAGSLFPVGRHVEFNPYYEHENNTGGPANHPENAVGLALYLFFPLEQK